MRRSTLTVRLGAATVTAFLVASASAAGEVRQGSVQDGIDRQPPPTQTFDGPQQAVSEEVVSASVTYDTNGAIAATVTFNTPVDPPRTFGNSATLHVLGPEACATNKSFFTDTSAYREQRDVGTAREPHLELILTNQPVFGTEDPNPPDVSYGRMTGVNGELIVPTQVSPDGRSLTATFASPQFANRPWRCVAGLGGEANDLFSFYFAGMEPKVATPQTATGFLSARLAQLYGEAWTGQPRSRRWIACPRQGYFEPYEDEDTGELVVSRALCMFRFPVGNGRFREGTAVVTSENESLVFDFFKTDRPFSQAVRSCRIRRTLRNSNPQIFDRSLRASGYLKCHDGPAAMIRDLHYLKPGRRRVGFHGTNRAGFEKAVQFSCDLKARRGGLRTATCRNGLGDRFVYRFRVRR